MIEQFDVLSEKMIDTLQNSLKRIRQSLDIGVQEFANLIGVTRQTMNNLESQKSQMNVTQFVAICSVIDYCTANSPQLRQIVNQCLRLENGAFWDTDGPLSRRWFMLFEDVTRDDNGTACDLKNLAENYRIFFDDSIFLNPMFENAAEPLLADVEKCKARVIVPSIAIEILRANSEIGINILNKMIHRQIVEIRGEKNDSNVISTLVSVFAKFKCKYKLALFTQNEALANQILNLNGNAIGGFDILVYRLNREGEFKSWSNFDSAPNTDSMNSFSDLEIPKEENTDIFEPVEWDRLGN